MTNMTTDSKKKEVYIPEHQRKRYEEEVNRGWRDPDTYEVIDLATQQPIRDTEPIKFSYIPKLAIKGESLHELMESLLNLGLNDNNKIITKLYFEMIRRGPSITGSDRKREKQLYDLVLKKEPDVKTNMKDISEPLPIDEPEYIRMATLLGKLTIDDSVNISMLGEEYKPILSSTFLYLQNRARNANGFKLNEVLDDMENNITALLAEIIKGPEEPKKDQKYY